MQDRYAFDVGDFGKVGLLRALDPDRLGVVWYMTDIVPVADDGRHTGYLDKGLAFRPCDPDLFDAFRTAMAGDAPMRSVARLEGLGVLPRGPRFGELVAKGARRGAWFDRARAAVRGADFVFCDPDNGIANPGSTAERSGSAQHVTLDEVTQLYGAGHSVVVYHHLTREKGGHVEQIQRWRARLASATGCPSVGYVHLRRGSARVFFLLVQGTHEGKVARVLFDMNTGHWQEQGHMVVVAP